MTPHGTRPAAGALLVLALAAACQSPTASLVPSPSATAVANAPSPSPSPSPTPSPSPSPTDAPPASPTPAPGARGYTANGEAGDVLFTPAGRIVMVTRDLSKDRTQVVELDANGAVLPGWPWSAGDTSSPFATAALGPDGSVYVAVGSASADRKTYAWKLHRLDAGGRELAGFPVKLPPVEQCLLSPTTDGAVYVTCEHEDENTAAATSTLTTVRPDGSTPAGWPVKLAGSASIEGFTPDGTAIVWDAAAHGSKITALRADGSVAPGWPVAAPRDGGYATVDSAGRVHLATWTYEEDECGAGTGVTYSVLATDGKTLPGWPVHVQGWASAPLAGDDGSSTIVTQAGKAIRYGIDGSVMTGWPVSGVSVAVGCNSGSWPVSAGGGDAVVVGSKVTLLSSAGAIAPHWPVKLPYAAAIECPSCTPGPGAPLAPAMGVTNVYVAAYGGDRPRIITIGRDGTLVDGGQRAFGRTGDEIGWVRIAPSGRVWMLLTRTVDESTTSLLVPVGQDRPIGG
jgi:hypothetical protein